ncbi:beta-glucosidase [Methanocella arvoryzae]|nr:glycoside hydrolase family 3 C-terminal domain-containing protein [Methanocella arvoryzae]
MTLEEKASLCSGLDMFRLKGIARLGIPSILLSDGPHGLRKPVFDPDHLGIGQSIPSTCFPTASAMASSWDRNLLYEIGYALGEECLHEDVAVILGPGANIKRSPLCGRNFEYFSEDPYLTGELAASMIEGIQATGVGASLKHFAVNNQEYRRMTIDAIVDERTLREIYLAGFEMAVKQSRPRTVMCSYNKVNGVYASEHERLLTDILRKEWGYEGLVMTDWGACDDRVAGLKAGQDLEMPSSFGVNDAKIVKAVRDGTLSEAVLDEAVERVLELVYDAVENRLPDYCYEKRTHHVMARQAAAESMVLLKNDGILPLKKGMKIAVIGAFAIHPRYQGNGSSQVNPCRLEKAYCELCTYTSEITFARGYDLRSDVPDERLITEACNIARGAEVAIIFAGLPDSYETEGMDREHMRMPESHNELIRRVAEANPGTVVVLANGAPVEMPWLGNVKAVLEGYLGGEAAGGAAADLLFGMVNPSGKLAETFALQLDDYPSANYFPSGPRTVEYREGLYVGYRYFDTAKKAVLFPFGHGLSYTSFEYSDMEVSASQIKDDEELKVGVLVKNTGDVAGAEVIQLYVRDVESTIFRPEKELKGFDKVFLQPGEMTRVEFTLDRRSFAYYNVETADWHVESGDFEILIGSSSADIRARETIWVESTRPGVSVPDLRSTAGIYYNLPPGNLVVDDESFKAIYGETLPSNIVLEGEPYTINSTLGEVKETFFGRIFFELVHNSARNTLPEAEDGEMQKIMTEKMLEDLPLRNVLTFSEGKINEQMLEGLLLLINRKPAQGLVRLSTALLKIG